MNVTLPIGHLLLLKVSYNLVPFIRNLQRSINFLLTCPKFICHVLDTSTLLHFCHILHHMSSFWNYFDFIVKNCIGYQGTGLWTPDQDSDVTGLVLTMASTSTSNAWNGSSFRLARCILSSEYQIKHADLMLCSHTPPI